MVNDAGLTVEQQTGAEHTLMLCRTAQVKEDCCDLSLKGPQN